MLEGIFMERREPGRLANAPGHGRLLLWTLGYALAAFALLSMHGEAFAARLVDVRVGEHKGYTRVVLELDSLAAYQVSEPREGADTVMKVELDALGDARSLTPSHPVVKAVLVEPSGAATAIHVKLEKAEVQINEMILLSPPRLVFDIRDPAAVTAAKKAPVAAVSKTASAPTAAPREAEPTTARRDSSPAADPVKAPKTLTPPAPSPTARAVAATAQDAPSSPAAANSSAPPADPMASAAAGAMATSDLAGVATDPGTDEAGAGPATAAMDAPAQAPGRPLALEGAATGRPNAMAMPARRAADPSPIRAVPPLPSERRADAGAQSADSGAGLLGKVRGFFAGINKIAIAGVAGVVVLLLVFVIRRGRGADDALSPVMAADHLGGEGDELFGGPDDSAATEPVPTTRSAPAAPPPPSAPPSRDADGTLESRVSQLEATLMQLAQARENMERQLAAQTEELRVQRAAIARTQRVVRSFGEGDEDEDTGGATEPVPRMPAS